VRLSNVISSFVCKLKASNFSSLRPHALVAYGLETAQIVRLSNVISSFVCIRGSIPLFWKQDTTDWTQLKPKLCLATNEPLPLPLPGDVTHNSCGMRFR
jgi:hypothetical protein